MHKRFVSIWFCYPRTDWFTRRNPHLSNLPFVLVSPDHGRMLITAANVQAKLQSVHIGMALADARAFIPGLEVMDDDPDISLKLLNGLAVYCLRFSPVVAIDLPDGIILDVTGCTHLWGGDQLYISDITARLNKFGYTVRVAIADTIGTAWAIAHYGNDRQVIEMGQHRSALLSLPAAALRLEETTIERLEKLGLSNINDFISMPRPALRRRFGMHLLKRIDEALGYEEEFITPIEPINPYQERLPCLEPIMTATGIEIAIDRLLAAVCKRLQDEQKGLRKAVLKCYRSDGKIVQSEIGTNRASCNCPHLLKLFSLKIDGIQPEPGIELFTLDALKIEPLSNVQEELWEDKKGLDDTALSELLDRIGGKIGDDHIQRYFPAEHYWPERSFKLAASICEKPDTIWKTDKPRPLQLLSKPVPVEVTAPIPDYPPMLFRHKGKLHKIVKADGPERIEQEWWLQEGLHRDYYIVEDEEGQRYWLFRSGHYDISRTYQWFIHGFFA